ncbi:MAG TPA: sigma-54 dependent transcriptional regulator [bacterium]|nr:sigma-54 dependent transcriptional regulator [bacterium]
MSTNSVLLMHDGRKPAPAVEKALVAGGWRVESCSTRKDDWRLKGWSVDCVVLLLEGENAAGAPKLVERIRAADDNLPVVVVARDRSLEHAVAAMRSGAHDYLSHPADSEKLRHAVANAMRLYGLTKRVFLLESQMGWRGSLDDMVGASPQMQEIFQMVRMVAKSNATVLITGESGTGKELVARAIHRHSARSRGPSIDINCGAIPRELLENELFGHERGAYTGADKRYIGSCERADGGTLFLDEISEMDPLLQVKLLRFLQERSFTRVGGNDPIKVDVRIVTATNRDISREVADGRFREDLYYRLNVVPIHIPPLRERREDIPLLAKHFLEKYSAKNEKIFLDFAPQALDAMVNYEWPGNVRELENIVERVVVLNNDSRVKLSHLPPFMQDGRRRASSSDVVEASMAPMDGGRILPLDLVEKYAIEAALKRCLGSVSEAARKLKVGQATLYRKIRQYGLR